MRRDRRPAPRMPPPTSAPPPGPAPVPAPYRWWSRAEMMASATTGRQSCPASTRASAVRATAPATTTTTSSSSSSASSAAAAATAAALPRFGHNPIRVSRFGGNSSRLHPQRSSTDRLEAGLIRHSMHPTHASRHSTRGWGNRHPNSSRLHPQRSSTDRLEAGLIRHSMHPTACILPQHAGWGSRNPHPSIPCEAWAGHHHCSPQWELWGSRSIRLGAWDGRHRLQGAWEGLCSHSSRWERWGGHSLQWGQCDRCVP